MANVTLSLARVTDWASFHSVSAETFGFPDFYGRNNNALIDCLSYLPDGDAMSKFELADGEHLLIHLTGFEAFQQTHGELARGLLDCAAAVNSRYIARGDIPRLALLPS
jgi:hypothetical protein